MNKKSLFALTILFTLTTGMASASDLKIKKWEISNYKKLDTDGNGSLDTSEFRSTTKKWMDNLGWNEKRQVKATNNKFKKYDTNKNKQVSLDELVTGNRKERARKKQKKN